MLLAPENANRDLPPIGFCNEPLIGSKYAVCQEILTEFGAVGQETLTKTLLTLETNHYIVREVIAMWKAIPTAAFILALLFSALATDNFVQLGVANPWYEDRWTDPPVISIHSPTNETYRDVILINFTMTKPEKWKSYPTVYLGTPTRYGDVQQLDHITIEVDEKLYRLIEVHSNLSSPFSYSENLSNLRDGIHSLRIFAYGAGVIEGCEWKPNTSAEINSSSVVNFRLDTVFPRILLALENKTYYSSDIPLDFTVNEQVSQIAYNLDGGDNVTIAGNTTLTNLHIGLHNVTVYAWDDAGNMGVSETIYFNIAQSQEPFPVAPVAAASGASVAVVGLGLLLYFKKRRHAEAADKTG